MTSRKEELRKEIPDIVVDGTKNKRYLKGKFLGKVYSNHKYVTFAMIQVYIFVAHVRLNLQRLIVL